ncbi:hypothetical protein [Methylobacterium sp. JK268]
MIRRWKRLGLEALGVGAAYLVVLAVAGGTGAAALDLRPGLDPLPPAFLPEVSAPVRVILALPWERGSEDVAAEARRSGISDSR